MSVPHQSITKKQSIDLDSPSQHMFTLQHPKNTILNLQSHEAQFQKNYPKNIFIPLVEYLNELGYKQAYEKCVGSKTDFQGKNVVPLASIYTLITQDWFLRNINKLEALSHLSNKILINSKIKKKLFHLLIAQLILMTDFIDVKDFKRKVSREANLIAKRKMTNDQIFSYPNAIIYLLHTFLKILMFHAKKKGYNKLEQEFSKMSLEDASPTTEAKPKNIGSKEQYKFYVKQIVHIFGSKGIAAQNYTDVLQEVKQTILEKDKLFRQKYQLIQGIPNWIHFVDCVVMRCFEHKKKDAKITNFLFNDWITECKNKMLTITKTKQSQACQVSKEKQLDKQDWIKNSLQFHSKWAGLPLPLLQSAVVENQSKNESLQQANKAKEFSPIILSKMNDNE